MTRAMPSRWCKPREKLRTGSDARRRRPTRSSSDSIRCVRILQTVKPREETQVFDGVQVAIEICVVRKKADVPPRLFGLFTDIDALDPQLAVSMSHQRRRDL